MSIHKITKEEVWAHGRIAKAHALQVELAHTAIGALYKMGFDYNDIKNALNGVEDRIFYDTELESKVQLLQDVLLIFRDNYTNS